jgi:glyoxylase-like metal-dependent hydrolase (beta-lactamase superfamily II)
MNPLTLGKLSVTRVEEMIWEISPRFLFPDLTYESFEPHREWLVPHFSTEELKLRISIHSFVVRTPHHTVVVDTCIGNDRKRDVPLWDHMRNDYLARLAAAGVNPEEVDYVFCTHMHVDHVGWNTHLRDGRWVPTFPNARYLFNRREWEYWKDTADENQAEVVKDSLLPILDAGLADMVEETLTIGDEISLEPTPGHTPGHCSVRLVSGGEDAVITGDMFHHPSQIAEPHWGARVDWDRELGIRTRRGFVERYADTPTLILGTHFAPPTALRLVSRNGAFGVAF